jgi:hypothetical protein
VVFLVVTPCSFVLEHQRFKETRCRGAKVACSPKIPIFSNKTTRCHKAQDHNLNPHCLANTGFTYRIYTTVNSYGNACMAPDWRESSGCCNTNLVLHHKFVCRSCKLLSHRLNFNFVFLCTHKLHFMKTLVLSHASLTTILLSDDGPHRVDTYSRQ